MLPNEQIESLEILMEALDDVECQKQEELKSLITYCIAEIFGEHSTQQTVVERLLHDSQEICQSIADTTYQKDCT